LINFGINPKKIIPTQETVIYLNRLMLTFQPIPQRKKRIGISIYSTQRRTESQYQNYISSIAGFCDYTVAKGFEILFFPMEMKDASPDDRPMIKCIMDHVHDISNIAVLDEDLNTVAHLKAVSECQLFVGHKTHSTIFSLTTGTPLIGIAYHPKTIEFMKQYGVENYAIKESELTLQRLIDKFNQILPNLSIIGESCFKKSRMIADGIEDGFMQIMKQCN
jgi:polysaccharide pyruvyl transferase WcaK-like protein